MRGSLTCVFVVVGAVDGGEAVGDGAEDAGLGTQAVQQLLVNVPQNLSLNVDPLAGEIVFLRPRLGVDSVSDDIDSAVMSLESWFPAGLNCVLKYERLCNDCAISAFNSSAH